MEKFNKSEIESLKIVHINKASVVFYCEKTGARYLATTRLANQILSGFYPDIYLMPREYDGDIIMWLATLSIF